MNFIWINKKNIKYIKRKLNFKDVKIIILNTLPIILFFMSCKQLLLQYTYNLYIVSGQIKNKN